MKGISIRDRSSNGRALAFDLWDILVAIGDDAISSTWRIDGLECLGPGSDAMHTVSDRKAIITGQRLYDLASKITQTVDGELRAFRTAQCEISWLRIRAVDGMEFDVECEDERILDQVRTRFDDIIPFDPEEH